MTARIGGRSIIEWFGHIFFNQDTEFYAIDKSQWLINEYLKFADLSGFDIKDTNFVKFITILIKQYVPLDQYIENEKFAYFQKIEKDYKDLKETFDYLWKELPEVHRHYIYKLVDFLGKENLTNEFLQSLKIIEKIIKILLVKRQLMHLKLFMKKPLLIVLLLLLQENKKKKEHI